MCGGIVGALAINPTHSGTGRLPRQWLFNLGRITSYSLVGAIAGSAGNIMTLATDVRLLQTILYIFANLILIGLGLYVAGWSNGITRLERIGRPIWLRLQPLTRKLLPVRRAWQALLIGGLWGWLPCGLVYTASISAFASANAGHGALLMLAFGLGTLPNLLLIGTAAQYISRLLQQKPWKRAAGMSIIAFGLIGLWRTDILQAMR